MASLPVLANVRPIPHFGGLSHSLSGLSVFPSPQPSLGRRILVLVWPLEVSGAYGVAVDGILNFEDRGIVLTELLESHDQRRPDAYAIV